MYQAAPPPYKTTGETQYAEQFATTLQQHLNELKEYKTKERSQIIPVASKTGTKTGSKAASTIATSATGAATTSKTASTFATTAATGSSATASTTGSTTATASTATTTTTTPPVNAMTYGLYSWSCYNHDVSSSSAFYTVTVDEGERYSFSNPNPNPVTTIILSIIITSPPYHRPFYCHFSLY